MNLNEFFLAGDDIDTGPLRSIRSDVLLGANSADDMYEASSLQKVKPFDEVSLSMPGHDARRFPGIFSCPDACFLIV